MTETYTFSRALSMMRYSGKKMRFDGWYEAFSCIVKDDTLYFVDEDRSDTFKASNLKNEEIMGSWIEVKE